MWSNRNIYKNVLISYGIDLILVCYMHLTCLTSCCVSDIASGRWPARWILRMMLNKILMISHIKVYCSDFKATTEKIVCESYRVDGWSDIEEHNTYQYHIDIFSRSSRSFAAGLARLLAESVWKVVKIPGRKSVFHFFIAAVPTWMTRQRKIIHV